MLLRPFVIGLVLSFHVMRVPDLVSCHQVTCSERNVLSSSKVFNHPVVPIKSSLDLLLSLATIMI